MWLVFADSPRRERESLLAGILGLKHGVPIDDAFRRPFRACGPGSVSRSMESGVRHEFSAQLQGVGAVNGIWSRPLVRSRPRQVGRAHGQREGLRTATGVGRGGYRRPNQTKSRGAAKCSPAEVLHPSAAGAA